MNPLSSTQSFLRISLAVGLALGLATLSGCGIGNGAPATGFDTTIGHIQGTLHGGPNPINGAKVALYATGDSTGASTGYGVGTSLVSTTTDANGNFNFSSSGSYTCPANQYAYIVATGGKTGSNNANPNSVLMAAIGPCTSVSSSTFVIVNELTTVAAGYALSNFMNVTGDAVNGYVIGIGAPATNNASAGCVNNAYYGTGTCPTTSAAGLAHAFANATALANSGGGSVNATTASGALVPVQEINTLGNILQACVNSNGGGTDLTSGAPTTTTSTAGHTTNDGTPCGKLFSYTSYTLDGTPGGTLNAPGNTLSAIQNLAKRPSGSATLFDANCSSGGTGTTPAATCIFNLGTPVGIYQTSMTAAPPDWMLGISYPSGSFSTASNGATCIGSPTTNGTLYPYGIATDINDNITILNEDGSAGGCFNLLTATFDGVSIGGNGFDTLTDFPLNVALDSFGHAIVPLKGSSENGIYVYAAGASDSNITLATSIAGAAGTTVTGTPQYVAVDGNDNIFVSSRNNVSNSGYLTTATKSHTSPTYNTPVATGGTSSTNQVALDNKNAAVIITSSGSGTGRLWGIAPGGTAIATNTASTIGGSTSSAALGLDTSGNGYVVISDSNSAPTKTVVEKFSYTATGGVFTFTSQTPGIATPTYTFPATTYGPTTGVMDGNNVLWFADRLNPGTSGATATSGHVTGYDTVNLFGTNNYMGCKFLNSTSTVCGSTDPVKASSTPYLLYQTRGMAIDAAGDIWVANAAQGQINEIIGLAAPTWPQFIHNGTSNKP